MLDSFDGIDRADANFREEAVPLLEDVILIRGYEQVMPRHDMRYEVLNVDEALPPGRGQNGLFPIEGGSVGGVSVRG